MPLAALSDQPGGLESPHHSTYPIPFHSNMDFHYLSHHVAHYNPTPGPPLSQHVALEPRDPQPYCSAISFPATTCRGHTQQQDFPLSESSLAPIPLVFLPQPALPGANRIPAAQGNYSTLQLPEPLSLCQVSPGAAVPTWHQRGCSRGAQKGLLAGCQQC